MCSELATGTVPEGGLSLERVELRELLPTDWPSVARIFADGIATRNATFETDVPSWNVWDGAHRPTPRLVATAADEIVGWAALAPVSSRRCYAGVAEASLYVAEGRRGRGVGTTLLDALIAQAELAGVWTLETGVFPENEASLSLLKRFDFREIGNRERIGQLDGVWKDVVLLERRSEVVT